METEEIFEKKEDKEKFLNLTEIKQEQINLEKEINTSNSTNFTYSNLNSEENIYEKTQEINKEKQEEIETNNYEYEEKNYEPSAIEIFFEKL
jgi:hypothetical protein